MKVLCVPSNRINASSAVAFPIVSFGVEPSICIVPIYTITTFPVIVTVDVNVTGPANTADSIV